VYIAQAQGTPQAADDAARVIVAGLDDLPDELAFDHRLILEDFRRFRQSGQVAPLRG
jgi:8-oxo-dGTP diphosphatase